MRKYEIIYAFLVNKGNNIKSIETYDDNMEKYYKEEIFAYNGGDAIEKFYKEQKFIQKPEIMQVRVVEEK